MVVGFWYLVLGTWLSRVAVRWIFRVQVSLTNNLQLITENQK